VDLLSVKKTMWFKLVPVVLTTLFNFDGCKL
jgi:hypothetical protein